MTKSEHRQVGSALLNRTWPMPCTQTGHRHHWCRQYYHRRTLPACVENRVLKCKVFLMWNRNRHEESRASAYGTSCCL